MYNKKTEVKTPCGYCGTMNLGKKWCGNKCSSAQWRKDHPYATQKTTTEKICGFDHRRRDTPKFWKRYLLENPEYTRALFVKQDIMAGG